MRGHIRKRGNYYSIVIDIGNDPITKKRKQKWYSGYKTKREAEKALSEIINRLENGNYYDLQNILVTDYLNKWLNNYIKNNYARNTYSSYLNIINRYISPNIGKIELLKLKPFHIQSLYNHMINDLNLSSSTINICHSTIHSALNQAIKWEILNSNPADAVKPPKKEKVRFNILNVAEVNSLLKTIKNTSFYLPVLLAVTTGMRRSELLALKWNNVDLDKGLIFVENQIRFTSKDTFELLPCKTHNSERTIFMLPYTIPLLKEHKKNQLEKKIAFGDNYNDFNFICTKDTGYPYNPKYISTKFYDLIRRRNNKYNIPIIRFHDLRHTHATLLIEQGINPKIVAERLGHKSIRTTLDIYSHALPSMQQEAAEKLNNVLNEE